MTCEYCTRKNKREIDNMDNPGADPGKLWITPQWSYLTVYIERGDFCATSDFPINNCPMCGRELKE